MDTKKAKSGQAMVEFCIGIVAVLIVIAGIFQLGQLGLARTDARVEATGSVSAIGMLGQPGVQRIRSYVNEVQLGSDGSAYSLDDTPSTNWAGNVFDRILGGNSPLLLSIYAPNNELSTLFGTDDMQASHGFVRSSDIETREVIPIARKLFFSQDTVDIEVTVWSVRTGDLY